jgi:hypothetical protein
MEDGDNEDLEQLHLYFPSYDFLYGVLVGDFVCYIEVWFLS